MDLKDYLNSVLQSKKYLITDEMTEKGYNPFLVNKTLSYHIDCVALANEMNIRYELDKKMQYDFLFHTVRKLRRPYQKWIKKEKHDNVEAVKKYYGVSTKKAIEYINILTESQLQEIKRKCDTGGV